MNNKQNIYWTIFISTFYISAVTFGGGYVIVPILKKKFVEDLKYIDDEEMMNMIAISQSSPGAVAINTSMMIGFKLKGALGGFISVLGTVLPPFLIISLISIFYDNLSKMQLFSKFLQYTQPAIAVIIFNVAFNLILSSKEKKENYVLFIIMITLILSLFKINMMYILLISALLGIINYFVKRR